MATTAAAGEGLDHRSQRVDRDRRLAQVGRLQREVKSGQFEQAVAVVGDDSGRGRVGELLTDGGHLFGHLGFGERAVVVVFGRSGLSPGTPRCPQGAHVGYLRGHN